MVGTILLFIAVLAVLVLSHEWGHFIAARQLGIAVEEFGFGFPPRLASVVRRGVRYSVNWLPLGGFVKLKGESGDQRGEADSFAAQPPWRRAVVLVAGVTMNVAVAWLLLSLTLGLGVPTTVSEGELARAQDVRVQVVGLAPGSPAEQAGIAVGDTILSLNRVPVQRITDLQAIVATSAWAPTIVTVERGGQQRDLVVVPTPLAESEGRAVLGVHLVHAGTLRYGWPEALWRGVGETWRLGRDIVVALGRLFADLVTRGTVPTDIAGPVGIAVLTGQVAELGLVYLLQFTALLSLNLAIINALPFPALDGGRLLFVGLEKLRRRQVSQRLESIAHQVGFALLMVLVLMVTYRDVVRLGSGFFANLKTLLGGS